MLRRYYYDHTRSLFYDINALGLGFGGMIYYVKGDPIILKNERLLKLRI